jgi:hypothetical protein
LGANPKLFLLKRNAEGFLALLVADDGHVALQELSFGAVLCYPESLHGKKFENAVLHTVN